MIVIAAEKTGQRFSFGFTYSAEILRQVAAELNQRIKGFSYDEEWQALVYAGPWDTEDMVSYVNGYACGVADRMKQAA